jgi:glycosyltransferase involved in cell wall biosynthesis
MSASVSHLVLIPTYNTGSDLLLRTVRAARVEWAPVWVVVDGSTDGSAAAVCELAAADADLRVIELAGNQGKGAAVLAGIRAADREGFTHVLVLDADGQHPISRIGEFMERSEREPGRMILGDPVFGPEAPRARVLGRRLSNALVDLETVRAGVGDSLFGFRVYPIRPLLEIMSRTRWMRGFDFDAEAAVRLTWSGILPIRVRVPVRYLSRDEGGVSHFRYVRDNALLGAMHARLLLAWAARLPGLLLRRFGQGSASAPRPD